MFDNDSYDPQVIYREVQDFSHPAMRLLMVAIDIIIIGNIVLMYLVQKKLIPSKPGGDDISATGFAVIAGLLIIFMLSLNWFLISLKLITEIRIDYLFIHLYPGFTRKIEYSDISKIEIADFSSLKQGGAWGYHFAPGWRCYHAPGGGKTAIQITRKDNMKIIISSREQEMVMKQIRDAARTYGVNL